MYGFRHITLTMHVRTCCNTISQGHDNFDVLWPELMNSLCWLSERRKLGTVEVNLTSHQNHQQGQNEQNLVIANVASETHS